MKYVISSLLVLMIIVLIRAIIVKTIIDRIIAINALTSMASALILLFAFYKEIHGFLDVAFVLMLCSFIGGLWILRALTKDSWKFIKPKLKKSSVEEVNLND